MEIIIGKDKNWIQKKGLIEKIEENIKKEMDE